MAQTGNQNPPKLSSKPSLVVRIAGRINRPSLWLAWIGIPLFVAVLICGFSLYFRVRAAVDAPAATQDQKPAPGTAAADPQGAIQAAVDAAIKRDELLLDKLLLLVGLYSTILSFLALSTVLVSRQDAKEQLANINAKASELADNLKKELGKIQTQAQSDINGLKEQVRLEFPIISSLQSRVQKLILDLEDRYPENEDSNRDFPRPDSWSFEERQQRLQIDESQILAVSVVALDDPNMVKLYLALARSYFERSRERARAGSSSLGDAMRAYLYASRAIECKPESADAYRMRGATTLARYHDAPEESRKSGENAGLLQLAREDFKQCRKIDPINAGALYNLALLCSYEDNPDEAIRISEELLAARDEVPRGAKEKYFPDVYINLACFIADKAKTVPHRAEQNSMYDRIVEVCTEGRRYLRTEVESSKALDKFKESLKRELKARRDFSGLPAKTRKLLEGLL